MTNRTYLRPLAGALIAAVLLAGCQSTQPAGAPAAAFSEFVYSGIEANPAATADATTFANPILTGFYPDPSITRVGADFYLVHSTFTWFPGLPVWHSTDLVNWTQIGNALDRPGMLDFDGLGLSRGVFAPTIEHHDGVFYIANTCVDCGGNCVITASNPAGPWSDPIWVEHVGGIDPSLFFDEDGKVWMMNNDAPPGGSTYDGHRAIWLRQVHPETFAALSEPVVIIDGGVRPEDKPIWIEGPHIYKRGGWYYLSAAEGGTAVGHSQVILRSRMIEGPYDAFHGNPIMTQRDLPEDRPFPVTSVGHADFVIDDAGEWWVTFLGVRPYEGDYYNTGRETFLLPVTWKDGWPIILDPGAVLPISVRKPALPPSPAPALPTTGTFKVVEDFTGPELPPHWMTPRVPKSDWFRAGEGQVTLTPRPDTLGSGGQPSFLARRQQHIQASADVTLDFEPAPGEEAGLAAFQSDEFWFALGITKAADGTRVIRLRQRGGPGDPVAGRVLAEVPAETAGNVRFRFEAKGAVYIASWSTGEEDWRPLGPPLDGKLLSTRTAGGFVGAVFGMYAERTP